MGFPVWLKKKTGVLDPLLWNAWRPSCVKYCGGRCKNSSQRYSPHQLGVVQGLGECYMTDRYILMLSYAPSVIEIGFSKRLQRDKNMRYSVTDCQGEFPIFSPTSPSAIGIHLISCIMEPRLSIPWEGSSGDHLAPFLLLSFNHCFSNYYRVEWVVLDDGTAADRPEKLWLRYVRWLRWRGGWSYIELCKEWGANSVCIARDRDHFTAISTLWLLDSVWLDRAKQLC